MAELELTPRFWALIVTVENYALNRLHPTEEGRLAPHSPALGAGIDGDKTYRYLIDDLHVPESNIIRLQDQQATRAGIISAFKSHLVDNENIREGDALFFHYSGHGDRVVAPIGWEASGLSPDGTEDNNIEAMVPYDEGTVPSGQAADRPRIRCIPDRTLGALIRLASERHGNNITVVLDCCHSGDGSRGGDGNEEVVARAVVYSDPTPLDTDLDRNIVAQAPAAASARGSRSAAVSGVDNHVLVAACGRYESAWGGPDTGGFFTGLWLDALRNKNIRPRTYAEILRHVDIGMARYRRVHRMTQHPQCDAFFRDRFVFTTMTLPKNSFEAMAVLENDAQCFYIAAGEVHGITHEMSFEIYEKSAYEQTTSIALVTAKPQSISPTWNYVRVDDNTSPRSNDAVRAGNPRRYLAILVEHSEQLKYKVVPSASLSLSATASFESFSEKLREAVGPRSSAGIHEASSSEAADVELLFADDGSVTLRCLHPQFRALPNAPPHIPATQVAKANFPRILSGIARFIRLLTSTPTAVPDFADSVDFGVTLLVETDDSSDEDGVTDDAGNLYKKDSSVGIIDGEARVLEDYPYAILLRSKAEKSLFVQVWYFDPNTFEIALEYKSPNHAEATLLANGELQIGASPARAEPLRFHRPDGCTGDTLFVKAYFTNQPVKLDFLQQDSLLRLGELEAADSRMPGASRRTRTEMEEVKKARDSLWYTILRKVTVE